MSSDAEILARYREHSRKSSANYRKAHGDRIKTYSFFISNQEYEVWKKYVDERGLTLSGLIKDLLWKDIESKKEVV